MLCVARALAKEKTSSFCDLIEACTTFLHTNYILSPKVIPFAMMRYLSYRNNIMRKALRVAYGPRSVQQTTANLNNVVIPDIPPQPGVE